MMESTKYSPVDFSEGIPASQEKRNDHWLHRHDKWRIGLFYAALATSVVCALNLIITIWAFATHRVAYGSADLYEGSCQTTKNLNIGIHLIINVFSSALLGGSNYTMQCLSSPTRKEVDEAHSRGTWLDIGVPSIRNLSNIAKRRKWLWLLLGASSIPLHLFYNSIVFVTLSGNSYKVYITNEAWLSSANLTVPTSSYGPYPIDLVDKQLWRANQAGELERLEPRACIDEYARSLVTTRSNLVVVTSNASSNSSEDGQIFNSSSGGAFTITGGQDSGNLDPYSWICKDTRKCLKWTQSTVGVRRCDEYDFCDIDSLDIHGGATNWTLDGRQVDYCLSEKADEHCKLRLNAAISAIVIIFNFLKAALIFFTFLRIKDHLLLNMGDAITSFLERPDVVTEGSCLLSREDTLSKEKQYKIPMGSRQFHGKRRYWFAAASRRRVITVFTACIVGLLICIALFIYGLLSMKGAKPKDIWSLGFGQPSSHTLITFAGIRRRMIRAAGVLSNVLIANSPQVILSFLYFSCNGLLTSMLLSHEWSSYARKRKGLRVHAQPEGNQRSTYFLQLPWRYAIPMLFVSTTLHWLVSQSIFLVSVEWWENIDRSTAETTGHQVGDWARDDFWDFATCGYSPLALLVFIVLAIFFICVVGALGFRKLPSGMPVAGSCSLAIAAACHVDGVGVGDVQPLSQMPLQWGAVQSVDGNGDAAHRCGFSARVVEYPTEGVEYG